MDSHSTAAGRKAQCSNVFYYYDRYGMDGTGGSPLYGVVSDVYIF